MSQIKFTDPFQRMAEAGHTYHIRHAFSKGGCVEKAMRASDKMGPSELKRDMRHDLSNLMKVSHKKGR